MTEVSPGRAAYEAYAMCGDGKSLISGAALPEWDELRPEIREAWDAAARAAAEAAPHECSMWEQAYMAVQAVLDKALGTEEEDGAGAGIVADVHLLALQRDEARARLADAREHATVCQAERDEARAELNRTREALVTESNRTAAELRAVIAEMLLVVTEYGDSEQDNDLIRQWSERAGLGGGQ